MHSTKIKQKSIRQEIFSLRVYEKLLRGIFCSPTQSIVKELLNKRIRRLRKKRFKSFQHSSSKEAYRKKFSFVPIIISKFNCELTFLNHPNVVTGGRASARHFKVTFSPSALVIFRDGSSFAKCTETVGGSAEFMEMRRVGNKFTVMTKVLRARN